MDCKSKLILFVSVDVVGATAYKNKEVPRVSVHPWLKFFEDFFKDFPIQLKGKLGILSPEVWKSAGDELIFTKEIKNLKEVFKIISAFKELIKEYSYAKSNEKDTKELKFKGTAWMAGLPVINAEIISDDSSNTNKDYIGPSIDTGFRLCKEATDEKFIISLEVASILSDSTIVDAEEYDLLGGVYFENEISLKGILKGKPYPLFWLPMGGDLATSKRKLIKQSKSSQDDIKEYCNAFIESVDDSLIMVKPYLASCDNNDYGEIPNRHKEIIEKLKEEKEFQYKKEDAEAGDDSDVGNLPKEIKKPKK